MRDRWVEGIAKNIRHHAKIYDWVRIAHSTNISLGMDWLDMDEFWQRAIADEVNDMVKEQNKASNEMMHQMQGKVDNVQPYRSPMDSMPKPSFFGAK